MRYRGGQPSMGNFVGKMLISELLNATHKPRWRIGNNINQCNLCGKCELICNQNALHVNPMAKTWTLNNRRCTKCLDCVIACPTRCLTQVNL